MYTWLSLTFIVHHLQLYVVHHLNNWYTFWFNIYILKIVWYTLFYSSSNRNNKQYSLHMFVYQVKSTVGFCSPFASVVSSCVIWIQTLVVVNLSHHMISTVDRAIVIILWPSSSSVSVTHFNCILLQITRPLWTKLGIRFLLQSQLFGADNASWIELDCVIACFFTSFSCSN